MINFSILTIRMQLNEIVEIEILKKKTNSNKIDFIYGGDKL